MKEAPPTNSTTAMINGKKVKVATPETVKKVVDKNIDKYAKSLENLKDR